MERDSNLQVASSQKRLIGVEQIARTLLGTRSDKRHVLNTGDAKPEGVLLRLQQGCLQLLNCWRRYNAFDQTLCRINEDPVRIAMRISSDDSSWNVLCVTIHSRQLHRSVICQH